MTVPKFQKYMPAKSKKHEPCVHPSKPNIEPSNIPKHRIQTPNFATKAEKYASFLGASAARRAPLGIKMGFMAI